MKRTYQPSKDPPRPHPRLPDAHEDAWWPRHHQRAPRQGPQAPRPVELLPWRRRMIGRLLHKSDFERVLAVPPCSRSAHFALHYLQARPGASRKPAAAMLCTDDAPVSDRPVDNSPGGHWLGCVVPKRHAARSVTRNMLRPADPARARLPAAAQALAGQCLPFRAHLLGLRAGVAAAPWRAGRRHAGRRPAAALPSLVQGRP
jgi:RNase P protein component